MKKVKSFFREEIDRVIKVLNLKKIDADLVFAVVTDSHLDDFEEDTINNICSVDQKASFDFIAHLGDILNGSIPRGYTQRILREEMEKYHDATVKGVFYPVRGNHDGPCEKWLDGTWMQNMLSDDEWYAATSFTDSYPNMKRANKKPYYYVDYPEKKIRLAVLCPFSYTKTEEGKHLNMACMEQEQIEWLKREAFAIDSEWTMVLFSHDGPLRLYDQKRIGEEPWQGNSKEYMEALLEARKKHGFSVAAWFIGHWHGEVCQIVEQIPFVVVGSQTCYVPSLWDMPATGHYEKRKRGTVTQDLWDAVVLKTKKRELYLCRFGAGEDRVIRY